MFGFFPDLFLPFSSSGCCCCNSGSAPDHSSSRCRVGSSWTASSHHYLQARQEHTVLFVYFCPCTDLTRESGEAQLSGRAPGKKKSSQLSPSCTHAEALEQGTSHPERAGSSPACKRVPNLQSEITAKTPESVKELLFQTESKDPISLPYIKPNLSVFRTPCNRNPNLIPFEGKGVKKTYMLCMVIPNTERSLLT